MDTFSPPRLPSVSGTSLVEQPRLISNKMGDGYVQDTPDGLNTTPGQLTLSWAQIYPSEVTAIYAFLNAHVGQAFLYTIPREGSPRKWIWLQRQRTYPSPTFDALTITLGERFTLP